MYSKVFAVLAIAAFASANDLHEGYNGTVSHKLIFEGHYAGDWKSAVRPGMDIFVNTTGLITGVNVTDLRDGKDGVASISSGGIGQENVTISLKSPNILRGYDFLVEVYADEETTKTNERGNRGVQESEYPEQKPSQTVSTTTGKPTDQQQQQVTGKPTSQLEHQVTGKPTSQLEHQITGKPTSQLEHQVTFKPSEQQQPGTVPTGRPTGQQEHHQHHVPTTGKPSQQQHKTEHFTTPAPKQEVEIPQEVQESKKGFQIDQQN
ncbi:T-cell immunoglobulin and mucin domain-containing protein 2-like [Cydia splendana]|uniref:T-cell immunoglobulin and mucin domain-containing protein 2-like n=1 Tax=Cydia splendana TaxID=1100963 RepID=UPI00300D31E2